MIPTLGTLSRISFLILIGIMLIISSFTVVAYYESQLSLIGNSINIAGKNRFLTSNLILVSEKYLQGRSTRDELIQSASALGENINFLKTGGSESGLLLKPLPREYLSYWNDVNLKWNNLYSKVSGIATLGKNDDQSLGDISGIENSGNNLVSASDILVSQLSQGASRDSTGLVQLQISLLIVNVAIHTLFLYLIIRMVKPIVSLTRAANEVKQGRFTTVNKTSDSKDEVSLLVNSFNDMVKEMQNYVVERADFINEAAHKLRNPIQPILGMAEVLQQANPQQNQKELLEVIVRNAHKLEKLTQEILDVARLEGGTLLLHKEKLDLDNLCKAIVEDYQRVSIGEGNDVHILYEDGQYQSPAYGNADPLRITEVLYNLLNNAVELSEGGNITVKIDRKLDSGKNTHEFKVQIVSSGKGIDPGIQAHLFEKFVSTSNNSSGLGLYISKKIIEGHGGIIAVRNNKDGDGATFSFTIPEYEPLERQQTI